MYLLSRSEPASVESLRMHVFVIRDLINAFVAHGLVGNQIVWRALFWLGLAAQYSINLNRI
jgi:hypothetical protein